MVYRRWEWVITTVQPALYARFWSACTRSAAHICNAVRTIAHSSGSRILQGFYHRNEPCNACKRGTHNTHHIVSTVAKLPALSRCALKNGVRPAFERLCGFFCRPPYTRGFGQLKSSVSYRRTQPRPSLPFRSLDRLMYGLNPRSPVGSVTKVRRYGRDHRLEVFNTPLLIER